MIRGNTTGVGLLYGLVLLWVRLASLESAKRVLRRYCVVPATKVTVTRYQARARLNAGGGRRESERQKVVGRGGDTIESRLRCAKSFEVAGE
jgi:hypothetical protein